MNDELFGSDLYAIPPDAWDRQIEEDARSGLLHAFYQALQGENDRHADIPLDEVLDQKKLS